MRATTYQRRTLRSIARANFKAIQQELGRECLTYCVEDYDAEQGALAITPIMTNHENLNGWVN